MGPTNVALVKYFQVDQEMRAAKAHLDAASKDVRVQERRMNDLVERHRLAQAQLRESQSRAGQIELDLKMRDAHIEKLRSQQATTTNNREYQAFLIEINTAKVDRNKVEDETMKLLEGVERGTKELAEIATHLEAEKAKLATMKEAIGGRLAELQAEIDAVKPKMEEAGQSVPPKARDMFDRMSDRFDGEAMSAISKPDRRREEYVCTACNMELVVDVYNKLHSRDELVFCPSCRRILYIPDDLPPEVAIKGKSAARKSDEPEVIGAKATKPRKSGGRVVVDETTKVLRKAAGESVRNAVAAGNDPIQCEIYLGARLVGTFKGQNVENLTRTAKFCLNEAGITGELRVVEKMANQPALSEPAGNAVAGETTVGPEMPGSTEASGNAEAQSNNEADTATNSDVSPSAPSGSEPGIPVSADRGS